MGLTTTDFIILTDIIGCSQFYGLRLTLNVFGQ